MKVLVSLDNRFFRTRNGHVYSNNIFEYNFWKRYLQVFDEVIVLARVLEINEEKMDKPQSDGPGVTFHELPYYLGPFQYLRVYRKLGKAVERSISKADVFILRVPGTVSTRLWHHLEKLGKPYGAVVVGDSPEAMKTATGNIIVRYLLRANSAENQRKQCKNAIASAYVTEFHLQQKYPPDHWSTYFSVVDLPNEAIITDSQLEQKISSFKDIAEGKRPLRICHVGTMSVAYKAQGVLLEAVSIACAKGLKIELNLVGGGQLSEHYKSKAVELGIEKYVNFAGQLPAGHGVREQLDLADIFVLPSLTEGLPSVLLEAMARGLPCIATNVGGVHELLSEEEMVSPNNVEELAEKIMMIASDFKLISEMAYRHFQKAQKYTVKELNDRAVEFFHKVMDATEKANTKVK